VVYAADGRTQTFSLGAHAPELSPDDVARIHRIWLEAVKAVGPDIHHRDIVSAALGTLEAELEGPHHDEVIRRLRQQLPQA
jgi:hypothetical protein